MRRQVPGAPDRARACDLTVARYQTEFAAAHRAVSAAARVCRAVQARLDEVRAITKDDRSPVTVADFASQAVVARELADRFGDVPLVAEESSGFLRDVGHRAHLDATVEAVRREWPDADARTVLAAIDRGAGEPSGGGFWTLDPVDGTKGFLRGQQYAVSLAYVENWRPVVGVLGCPNLAPEVGASPETPDARGTVAGAVGGGGAVILGDPGSEPVRIARGEPDSAAPIAVCSSVESAHTDQGMVSRILSALGRPTRPVRVDSQCKYLLVARGQADLYLRLPAAGYVERIWDHAAGALIAAEAGCVVTDLAGGLLDFSQGRGLERNRGVVCAPPALHAQVLEVVARLGVA